MRAVADERAEPAVLLDLFGRPHGPLGAQLRLIASLLGAPTEPAPLRCWTVAKRGPRS
jgi:hypothetical protein